MKFIPSLLVANSILISSPGSLDTGVAGVALSRMNPFGTFLGRRSNDYASLVDSPDKHVPLLQHVQEEPSREKPRKKENDDTLGNDGSTKSQTPYEKMMNLLRRGIGVAPRVTPPAEIVTSYVRLPEDERDESVLNEGFDKDDIIFRIEKITERSNKNKMCFTLRKQKFGTNGSIFGDVVKKMAIEQITGVGYKLVGNVHDDKKMYLITLIADQVYPDDHMEFQLAFSDDHMIEKLVSGLCEIVSNDKYWKLRNTKAFVSPHCDTKAL